MIYKHVAQQFSCYGKLTNFCNKIFRGIFFLVYNWVTIALILGIEFLGSREMAQWLRAMTILARGPGLIPSTQMVAYDYL